MPPTATIAIPVYNGAGYLRDAVDSALGQTCPDIEVIVVNDGSNDGDITRNICLSYGDKIRYLEKENGGVASALNLAINNMRGEYFSWLSHDDFYRADKIERQLRHISTQDDKTAISFSDYTLKNEPDCDISDIRLSRIYPEERMTHGVFPILTTLVHGCTLLIHRSHFERVGLFDETLRIVQDYDMWFRIFRGRRTLYIPESLVTVRLHPASGTNTLSGYNRETGAAYTRFILTLTPEEMRETFPSPAGLIAKIAGLLWSFGLYNDMRTVLDRMGVFAPEPGGSQIRDELHSYLERLAGGTLHEIIVFGAGVHGRRLLFDLAGRGISITGFVDNNPNKWVTPVCGLPCMPPTNLEKKGRGTLVIVALRNPESVVTQLRHLPCRTVTKQSLDAILLNTPPALPELERIASLS